MVTSQGVEKHLLAAGAHRHLRSLVLEPVLALELGGDRGLQLGDAVDVGVLGLVLAQRFDRGVLDVVGRRQIGLAGRQVDDIAALGLQLARLGRHGDGLGGLDAVDAVGKKGHGMPRCGFRLRVTQTARTLRAMRAQVKAKGLSSRNSRQRYRPGTSQPRPWRVPVLTGACRDGACIVDIASLGRHPMTTLPSARHHHRRPSLALRAQGAGRVRDEGRALSARPDRAVLRRRQVQRAQSAAAHPRLHRRRGLRLRQHGDLRVPGGALSRSPALLPSRRRPSAPGRAGSRSSPTRAWATSSSGASSTRR